MEILIKSHSTYIQYVYGEIRTKTRAQNLRLWWCRSVTHPIARSHHRLLLAAQFVEDVVGELDAARPQLPCKRAGHRRV